MAENVSSWVRPAGEKAQTSMLPMSMPPSGSRPCGMPATNQACTTFLPDPQVSSPIRPFVEAAPL
ncbi:MAG: hypothetical protein ABI112_13855 [Terracoccus sp.]